MDFCLNYSNVYKLFKYISHTTEISYMIHIYHINIHFRKIEHTTEMSHLNHSSITRVSYTTEHDRSITYVTHVAYTSHNGKLIYSFTLLNCTFASTNFYRPRNTTNNN